MLIDKIHLFNDGEIYLAYSVKGAIFRYLADEMHFVDKLFPWTNYPAKSEFSSHFSHIIIFQKNSPEYEETFTH